MENIYTLEGKQGHEIIQVYECDFVNSKFYQLDELTFFELDNSQQKALWIDIASVKSGKLRLVAEQFCDYL